MLDYDYEEKRKMTESSANEVALQYLGQRYEDVGAMKFPLRDESCVSEWREWEKRRLRFPDAVQSILKNVKTHCWIERTAAGRIPVVFSADRTLFERLYGIWEAKTEAFSIPPSVNAFTVAVKLPEMKGHRVILMNRAGYSALSGEDVGIQEDVWIGKSTIIRLYHECFRYFILRALGGMKNHVLDEVAADYAGQIAAFGRFSASLQRKFFGLTSDGDGVKEGGRLWSYVKNLPAESVPTVCRHLNAALDALESHPDDDGAAAICENPTDLALKLATAGILGIAGMKKGES